MTTLMPGRPERGVKEVMEGGIPNINPGRTPVPAALVTDTSPEVPLATVATMVVGDCMVNDAAGMPPKLTPVLPVKFTPVIVTCVPLAPIVGEKDKMNGSGLASLIKMEMLRRISENTTGSGLP